MAKPSLLEDLVEFEPLDDEIAQRCRLDLIITMAVSSCFEHPERAQNRRRIEDIATEVYVALVNNRPWPWLNQEPEIPREAPRSWVDDY